MHEFLKKPLSSTAAPPHTTMTNKRVSALTEDSYSAAVLTKLNVLLSERIRGDDTNTACWDVIASVDKWAVHTQVGVVRLGDVMHDCSTGNRIVSVVSAAKSGDAEGPLHWDADDVRGCVCLIDGDPRKCYAWPELASEEASECVRNDFEQ